MKEQIQKDVTRPITADTAAQIEGAANEAKGLASVLFVMQGAFFTGDAEPIPEIMAAALGSVGQSLMQISEKLDHIMENIFKDDLEKGKE